MQQPFGRAPACERAAQSLSLRLDGELSELEVAQLRAHLAACPACSALEREVAALTRALRAEPLVAPSHPFVVPRLRGARVRSLRPLMAAAAAFVVVVGSVGSLMRSGFESQPGGGSLGFRNQLQQVQFANVEHKRIEQKPATVDVAGDTARQTFERLQIERVSVPAALPAFFG